MEKFGLFFSNASFDYKTKTSSIGIFNMVNKKEYSFVIKAKNPTDAEIYAMKQIIDIAQKEEILNVAIISDSKHGISFMKKDIYNQLQKQKEIDIKNDYVINEFRIRFLQFLWVPREYNQIADLLSKNINEKNVEAFQLLKEDNIKEKKESIDKMLSKVYVKNVSYNKNFTNDKLDLRCQEFYLLCNLNNINENFFKSKISKNLLLNNFDIDLFEELILDLEEIDFLETDIKNLETKNILIKISLEFIKDLLIFN